MKTTSAHIIPPFSLLLALALAFLGSSCTNPPPPPLISAGIDAPQKVDLLVFADCYDAKGMKALEWARCARARLKEEIREYRELDPRKNSSTAGKLQVFSTPLIIVVQDTAELGRFVPASEKQIVNTVRSFCYY